MTTPAPAKANTKRSKGRRRNRLTIVTAVVVPIAVAAIASVTQILATRSGGDKPAPGPQSAVSSALRSPAGSPVGVSCHKLKGMARTEVAAVNGYQQTVVFAVDPLSQHQRVTGLTSGNQAAKTRLVDALNAVIDAVTAYQSVTQGNPPQGPAFAQQMKIVSGDAQRTLDQEISNVERWAGGVDASETAENARNDFTETQRKANAVATAACPD